MRCSKCANAPDLSTVVNLIEEFIESQHESKQLQNRITFKFAIRLSHSMGLTTNLVHDRLICTSGEWCEWECSTILREVDDSNRHISFLDDFDDLHEIQSVERKTKIDTYRLHVNVDSVSLELLRCAVSMLWFPVNQLNRLELLLNYKLLFHRRNDDGGVGDGTHL